MGRLHDQIAIITGAASGMGKAQAQLFAKEGARVVLTDISANGQQVADEIGTAAAFCQHDVSTEESWASVLDFTVKAFGNPSILINTAGVVDDTLPIEDTSVAAFDRIVGINLRGVFLGMRAVVDPMKSNGGGSIVNIASAAALAGAPGYSAYASSKGGVRALSRQAARELGPYGIRVNSIYPGSIRTPIITASQMAIVEEFMAAKTPLGRLGEPEEIATATLFLASAEASYITGAELIVDGGFLS